MKYFFSISDGTRVVHDREGTELAGLADVQQEIVDFGLKVLRHRFSYGIEDPALWSIHASNEMGRVLAKVPLIKMKRRLRRPASGQHARD